MPFEMMTPLCSTLMDWDGEFRNSLSTITKRLKAGQWTDDTQMSMALAEALLLDQTYSPATAAKLYLKWFESDDVRGIGSSTSQALMRLKAGATWTQSGVEGAEGNGTAMRAAPIGILFRTNLQAVADMARIDAEITHRSLEAREGSVAIAMAVALLLNGTPKEDLVLQLFEWVEASKVREGLGALQVPAGGLPFKEALDTIIQMGAGAHVIKTVPAAVFALLATDSFRNAIRLAILAGGDTDTTAAVTGALAGSLYGLEGVGAYTHQVEEGPLLHELEHQLYTQARVVRPYR